MDSEPQPLLSSGSGPICPERATPCVNGTINITCHNGGICCKTDDMPFCVCRQGYEGQQCERDISNLYELLESRDRAMSLISLSSAISIAVGIIALLSLGVITFIIIRSRKRRPWILGEGDSKPDLDKTIIYVQEEISKLSAVQQLNKLHRLSKLFEKTVREAILSEPGHRVERPSSVAMNEYLPRWSSARPGSTAPRMTLTSPTPPQTTTTSSRRPGFNSCSPSKVRSPTATRHASKPRLRGLRMDKENAV